MSAPEAAGVATGGQCPSWCVFELLDDVTTDPRIGPGDISVLHRGTPVTVVLGQRTTLTLTLELYDPNVPAPDDPEDLLPRITVHDGDACINIPVETAGSFLAAVAALVDGADPK